LANRCAFDQAPANIRKQLFIGDFMESIFTFFHYLRRQVRPLQLSPAIVRE
jgi:hypothetical protein